MAEPGLDSRWLMSPTVAIVKTVATYPIEPPYHAARHYPEAPFSDTSPHENNVYDAVRMSFAMLGLDAEHQESFSWNPLGELIRPGDRVLLKPNLIRESHQQRTDWQQVITHGSVVRAVLDYVILATGRTGQVTVADGPQTDSDFGAICQRLGLDEIAAVYRRRGFNVEVRDLRRDRWFEHAGVIERREPLPGDPHGYTSVELGGASEFADHRKSGRFYGADYDVEETVRFHADGRHEYILCRSAMDADVVVNLPKLKTHKKVGVTLSLKNLVGINGYRNCLPHHTIGTPACGGDEFPHDRIQHKLQSQAIGVFKRALVSHGGTGGRAFRLLKRGGQVIFGDTQQVVRSGNWYGNDTAWRMVLDLNKSFFYHDGEGKRSGRRRYMTIVDGIVGGEGNGPVAPDAKPAGVLIAGFNPVAVDTVCATLMGFDYRRLPQLSRAWTIDNLPLTGFTPSAIWCCSNVDAWCGDLASLWRGPHLNFRPHFGWVGAIERNGRPDLTLAAS
jgi:uncharacterized protein (DUF362 family)